jgi:hypothetical protein
MGLEFIAAALGGAALTYSLGRLIRANLREDEREVQLGVRRRLLEAEYELKVRPAPELTLELSDFDRGFLAGVKAPKFVEVPKREEREKARAG